MRDDEFHKIMDAWVDHDTESAPELRPTADMYQLLETRKTRAPWAHRFSRRAIAGAAAAALTVVVVLYAVLLQPKTEADRQPRQAVAYVGQREGFVAEKGVVVEVTATPLDREPGKGPASSGQLTLQVQKRDSQTVEAIDLQAPQQDSITLNSADNYRLSFSLAEDQYVYVFQLIPTGDLVQLFPNATFSSVQNPLRSGQAYFLPSEPNWFYLGEMPGKQYLYVISSALPLQALEAEFSRYIEASDESKKQENLSRILETLDTLEFGRVIVFDHRH